MVLRLIVATGLLGLAAPAGVPPGPSYDPALHPNPIVTFVETRDFAAATYDEARELAGIDLIGPSGPEGTLESIHVAPSRTLEVRILRRRTEVLTFPVVLQTFRLSRSNALFYLYSFRQPRTDLPANDAELMLNSAALAPANDGEGRFGRSGQPDMLSVRGRPALMFTDEAGHTLFWEEGGTSHVAVSGIDEDDLFWIVEDLL